MADFDLAMALTADGSQAVAEVDRVAGSLDKVTAAEGRAAGAANTLEAATGKAATAATQNAAAQSQAGQATAEAAAKSQQLVVAQSNLAAAEARATQAASSLALAQQRAAAAAADDAAAQVRLAAAVDSAQARVASAAAGVARAQAALTRVQNENIGTSRNQQFAIRNIGQQFGDFGLQVATGQDPMRAFGQQVGQLGFALGQLEKGPLAKVGSFLVGPWGIALTVAAAFLVPLIGKLFEAGHEAEEFLKKATAAATAADSFGNAQSLLGRVIDLTTGKLKTQNTVLLESIRLQALAGIAKARADQAEAGKTLAAAGKPGFFRKIGDALEGGSDIGRGNLIMAGVGAVASYGSSADPRLNDIATRYKAGALGIKEARIEVEKLGLSADRTNKELLKFIAYGTAANDEKANQEVLDALDGKGIAKDLVPYQRAKKPKKPKKPADTDGLVAGVQNDIASLTAQFTDAPTFVEKARAAIAKLDRDIGELRKKKPPNFQTLIDQAEQAKGVIADNIAKPFDDFVKSQADSLELLKLQAAGQNDQAEALRIVLGLEKQLGPLTPARKDAVLATVEALRAEQRQIDINREHVGLYLSALGGIKSVVEDATQAFVRGDLGQLIKSPGKLLDVFQTLQGRDLFDKIFGGAFRELQDQVNGTSVVEDASARMADAVDLVTAKADDATSALGGLAKAANGAAGAITGDTGGPGLAATVSAASGNVAGSTAANDNGTEGGEVVVTARRVNQLIRNPTALFAGSAEKIARSLGIGASQRERDASLVAAAKAAGLTGKNDTELMKAAQKAGIKLPDDVATKIGKFAGKGIEGAAAGAFANSIFAPLAKGLGLKTSATGAKIGGALGGLTGLPFAGEIGGILGSVVGGLFKKTKSGSATIGNVDGVSGVTGTGGNSASYRAAATGSANAVGSALDQIVQQLGGQLGNFSVSIGQRKGKYVVDPTGRGRTKGSGVQKFGSEDEAQAAALRDAILDGAVGGLSAAMNQALRSNPDVTKAVNEALKVQQVELFIGGAAGQLKKAFDDLDRQAADRVRIARQYGLDVLAVEKLNAEERTKLVAATLKAATGSLQDLLNDLASGDLFEGTAADKRNALLESIAGTRARAEAGEQGAADELAALYRKLYANTRDAFGTAGPELGSDTETIKSGAAAVIKAEQDRVNQAAGLQQATTDAVVAGNALANEGNNLMAVNNNLLGGLAGAFADQLEQRGFGGIGGGGTFDYASTFRNTDLVFQ